VTDGCGANGTALGKQTSKQPYSQEICTDFQGLRCLGYASFKIQNIPISISKARVEDPVRSFSQIISRQAVSCWKAV